MFTAEGEEPRFLGLCSLSTAAKIGIVCELIFATATLVSRCAYTGKLVNANIFQVVVGSIAVSVSLLGMLCIFAKYRTTMLIFLLLDALSLVLNILAWIIIIISVSKMSLYEALCNSPGDCPVLFNPKYAIGLAISVIGALFYLINLVLLKCYIELLQYWERDAREQEQRVEAAKRAALNVTTDVQTSLLGTPRSIPKTSRWSILSRPSSSLGQSAS